MPIENWKNHEHHRIPLVNNENLTNLRIPCENTKTTNHGNHRISKDNNENHEIVEFHLKII